MPRNTRTGECRVWQHKKRGLPKQSSLLAVPTRLEYIFAYFLCIIVYFLSSSPKCLKITSLDFFVYFKSSFYQFIKSSILLIAVQLFGRKNAPKFLQTESSFQRIPCLQAIARPYSERLFTILLTKTMPNHTNRESALVNLDKKNRKDS